MDRSDKIKILYQLSQKQITASDVAQRVDEARLKFDPMPASISQRLIEAEERTPGTIEAYRNMDVGRVDKRFQKAIADCLQRIKSKNNCYSELYDASDPLCQQCAPGGYTNLKSDII